MIHPEMIKEVELGAISATMLTFIPKAVFTLNVDYDQLKYNSGSGCSKVD